MMPLRLESRPVGEVLIVQCHGRIVSGNEVFALHAYVGDSFSKYVNIVMQLDDVPFVDSSGLGALVRLMRTARDKGGDLKLSGVPANILEVLQMTNLISQFETYDSVDEAITAAYLGSRYSKGIAGDARHRVLCLFESADVRAFIREVLFGAGYNALTVANIDDARLLLKATKAKQVVVSSRLQSVYGKPTRQVLQEIDPAVSLLVLDETFATEDPGQAAQKLLSGIAAS
jgi:anti-sigma B factor antagonist